MVVRLTALLAALAGMCVIAAPAGAHATVQTDGGSILYIATDRDRGNEVLITVGASSVRIRDPRVYGGLDWGRCTPGEVDRDGFVIEATCPRTAGTEVRVEAGPDDDVVEVREAAGAAPVPTVLIGGSGADRLLGGAGADVLEGGTGQDQLEGRVGDDELRLRDGVLEVPSCGDGVDRAYLDDAELPDPACESMERTDPPPLPVPAPPPAPSDTTAPQITATAPRGQRLGRLGAQAVVSELAELSAVAGVRAGGRRFTFRASPRRTLPGRRARVALRGSRAAVRALRRELRRGRVVTAAITLVAKDEAGNVALERLPRVRLR